MEFDGSFLVPRSSVMKVLSEAEHTKHPMTLHCQKCSTVLGDSLGVCGEMKRMDSIICLKVTNDVVVGDAKKWRKTERQMANCIYSSLKCRSCRSTVGRVIHSAPSRLATVRSLFLLNKANISCYILNSDSMVNASRLSFNLKALGESIHEVRQQFDVQLDQIARIKSRLADRSGTATSE